MHLQSNRFRPVSNFRMNIYEIWNVLISFYRKESNLLQVELKLNLVASIKNIM